LVSKFWNISIGGQSKIGNWPNIGKNFEYIGNRSVSNLHCSMIIRKWDRFCYSTNVLSVENPFRCEILLMTKNNLVKQCCCFVDLFMIYDFYDLPLTCYLAVVLYITLRPFLRICRLKFSCNVHFRCSWPWWSINLFTIFYHYIQVKFIRFMVKKLNLTWLSFLATF